MVTSRGSPTCSSQARPATNSCGSEMLARSPVTAMWSDACALRSATIAASTSGRCMTRRLRCQLMKPVSRFEASSWGRGVGSGPRCGSDRCASANTSGAANQDSGEEHEHAADHDLERRLQEWRVHVAMADPRDDAEL